MIPVTGAREAWERTPLSRRMVLLMVSLLAIALMIAGTLMVGILQRHLVGQVDRQLSNGSNQLGTTIENLVANSISGSLLVPQRTLLPSDYYIRLHILGQPIDDPDDAITPATMDRAGRPDLDAFIEQISAMPLMGPTAPITVSSSVAGSTWRAIAVPIVIDPDLGINGVLIVALPLIGITETLLNTALSFLAIGIFLVVLAAIAGHYLVRRSLQPLRTIETVAGSIAAGDLSRRIPDAPRSTEVGSLASSLNAMLGQIERSFAANEASEQRMRRFVSDASHELRTPLAAIRGYGELYRMGAVPRDGIADVMGRIESESIRMGTLVEDLLTLARLDEGPELSLGEVDLRRVAEDTRSDMLAIDPSRKIKILGLQGRRVPSAVIVEADRNQIVQVFLNLAGNIVRYTPPGTPIEILLGVVGKTATVEFRDHGQGIPTEIRSRVFERFFRTEKSRSRDQGGSGLGLSIVSSIVEAHRGDVALWETEPHGLTVRVTLPVRRDSITSH